MRMMMRMRRRRRNKKKWGWGCGVSCLNGCRLRHRVGNQSGTGKEGTHDEILVTLPLIYAFVSLIWFLMVFFLVKSSLSLPSSDFFWLLVSGKRYVLPPLTLFFRLRLRLRHLCPLHYLSLLFPLFLLRHLREFILYLPRLLLLRFLLLLCFLLPLLRILLFLLYLLLVAILLILLLLLTLHRSLLPPPRLRIH